MRLTTRILIFYLLISLAIFGLGGYAFYTSFKSEIYEEMDEQMRDEKKNIERLIASPDTVPSNIDGINFSVSLIESEKRRTEKTIERKDTLIFNKFEGKIPFRQWRFFASDAQTNYEIVVRKSLIDIEDISQEIAYSFIYGYLAFLLASLALNYLMLHSVFNPFYSTINKIKNYGLFDSSILKFPKSKVKEFNDLNSVLEGMTRRIHKDYLNIKEYTENASHEIQTPLAIISTKLELLMQNENLDENQAALIDSAYEATNRLHRLNQSLITLTRIENREYHNEAEVDLSEILNNIVSNMRENFETKGISVDVSIKPGFKVHIHPALSEILLQNLLTNALRYTPEKGKLIIFTNPDKIQISNSGPPLSFPPDKLFQRFVRSQTNSRSLGIGLSLVKKITEIFSLHIDYQYNTNRSLHVISLTK